MQNGPSVLSGQPERSRRTAVSDGKVRCTGLSVRLYLVERHEPDRYDLAQLAEVEYSTAIGIRAIGGIGRMNAMIGDTIAPARRLYPVSGVAARQRPRRRAKPTSVRDRLMPMCSIKVFPCDPFFTRSTKVVPRLLRRWQVAGLDDGRRRGWDDPRPSQ